MLKVLLLKLAMRNSFNLPLFSSVAWQGRVTISGGDDLVGQPHGAFVSNSLILAISSSANSRADPCSAGTSGKHRGMDPSACKASLLMYSFPRSSTMYSSCLVCTSSPVPTLLDDTITGSIPRMDSFFLLAAYRQTPVWSRSSCLTFSDLSISIPEQHTDAPVSPTPDWLAASS